MRRLLVVAALGTTCAAAGADPKRAEWTVGDLKREALVHAPDKAAKEPCPVVFVFHGHGGSMRNAEKAFAIHTVWPDAICVYPQGVPTPGKLSDPGGKKSGWQHAAGDHGDRDLTFFDAVLKSLRADYKVDGKRVYATGHSNGGAFTYLLWAARGDDLAAVAPSGAAFRNAKDLKPKPCLHVAGEADPLVKYDWQKGTMEAVRKVNGCEAQGKEWAKEGKLVGTLYPSAGGAPLVAAVHPGGHTFPADDAPKMIVKFFKEHAKK